MHVLFFPETEFESYYTLSGGSPVTPGPEGVGISELCGTHTHVYIHTHIQTQAHTNKFLKENVLHVTKGILKEK